MKDKKIIEISWSSPTPSYFRDHIKQMEKAPVNGLGLKLPDSVGGGNVFRIDLWKETKEKDRQEQLDILASLPKSKVLTDNFVTIHGESTMDWFNDSDWKVVEENLRFCAKAAKISGFKGVFWDAEPYGKVNPWNYSALPEKGKHAFSEYAKQVRKRGGQFVRTLQSEFPGVVILSMRQLSDFQDGSPFSAHLLPLRGEHLDPKYIDNELSFSYWGLHVAFTDGMLDALDTASTFVDANEDAYFYTSELEFFKAYHTLKVEAQALVSPENRNKFGVQYEVGHAISTDYTAGGWAGKLNAFPRWLDSQATVLTPEQRAQWLEHNVYYTLATSDRYCWLYSESINWWEQKNIPPGFEEAIRSARSKYEEGKPLGFKIEAMMESARERLKVKAKK